MIDEKERHRQFRRNEPAIPATGMTHSTFWRSSPLSQVMKVLARSSLLAVSTVILLQLAEAQTPNAVSKVEPVDIDRVPEELKKADDELLRKLEAVRFAIEEEAAAKRIGEATAQSLRWSLRAATTGVMGDLRAAVATARVPADNATLSKLFQELETTNTQVQNRRTSLVADARREVRRRAETALREASKPAEIDELKNTIERFRDTVKALRGSYDYELQNVLTATLNMLGGTRRLLEAESTGDLAAIGLAASQLRSSSQYSSSGEPWTNEVQARLDRLAKPMAKALEDNRIALEAALAAHNSATEISSALTEYKNAFDRLKMVRSWDLTSGRDTDGSMSIYLKLAAFATRLASPEITPDEAVSAESIRNQIQQMSLPPDRGKPFAELIAKLSKEFTASAAKIRQERLANLRVRLGAVKQPSDLEPIARDLTAWSSEASGERGESSREFAELAGTVSALAATWTSESPLLLQQIRSNERTLKGGFSKEIGDLQARIEREVMSKVLRAPELNAAAAEGQSADAAVENFCDQLVKRGEWRRLYQVLEMRSRIRGDATYGRQSDEALIALRAYFTGQNFELAEQWREAAQSYKSVLGSASDRAPVKPAAERLKALLKEHPEAAEAKGPNIVPHLQKAAPNLQ